ncbi:hypothetical protein COY27_01775 [Candidatus Woesearchaeota archaeon CG_4_10_14_0_2_um_filter_33_13]|nr:MAG: hypothetical protein COY27_01775 [Candidatus Woesearchaeota archaeon CG_4_10_14_0_2_um_filter_33_13]
MKIIVQILNLLFLPNCPKEEAERPDYFKQWVRTKYGVYRKVEEQLLLNPGDLVLCRSYAKLEAQIRNRFPNELRDKNLEEVVINYL